jgi:proline dehydrogenase
VIFLVDSETRGNEPIMEKVLHRLVSKHIAGTTMSSALERAKLISDDGIGTSIMFLSGAAMEKPKAAYATTTYLELMRRIARLGIGASVHVRMEQIGLNIDDATAIANMKKINAMALKSRVFVWADAQAASRQVIKELASMKMGIACSLDDAELFSNSHNGGFRRLKILIGEESRKDKELAKRIGSLTKEMDMPVISSPSDELLYKLAKSGKNERNLILEFRLGYSKRRLRKAQKRKAKVSVLVPFGKDWVNYAMGNAPEGYMKFFAKRLFHEE